jgi:hypothetical protein
VGRSDRHPPLRRSIDPAAVNVAAWEDERVQLTVFVQDGKLKVTIEWRSRDGFPHEQQFMRALAAAALMWING